MGGGDGEVYECVTGPQCLDCNTQATMDGTLYCCSVDCDYAWIETWSENGNYYCQCGLDKKMIDTGKTSNETCSSSRSFINNWLNFSSYVWAIMPHPQII